MSETEDLLDEFGDDLDDAVLDGISFSTEAISDDKENNPEPEHISALQRHFGHTAFRPMQWQIISSILYKKRDNCAIMSTGYGKSLCFQFPSVYTGGVTLVISPLISLMEDQVLALTVANIPACLLGTANKQQRVTIEGISNNEYRLVYLTPEFCCGDYGQELLVQWKNQLNIILIAIDESHCVSSWGHDFRMQYRKLGRLRDLMPDIPILAVTATATEKVRKDIVSSLKLRNPQLLCSSLDRPNFYFAVNLKGDLPSTDFKKVMANQNGTWKFSGPTIVYCITRKMTEDIAELLQGIGLNAAPYHAGLSLNLRKQTHEKFVRDQIDVVVATIAFGMGIDKPDIRNIIHYGISSSIEAYYQEVGRAGRDGQPANCITFYGNGDFTTMGFLAKSSENAQNRERRNRMLEIVRDFLETNTCRRQYILNYFGETLDISNRDTCCDNCLKPKNRQPLTEVYEGLDKDGNFNFSTDARLLLGVINICPGYGLMTYVRFLKGSKDKKLARHHHLPLHGAGKGKHDDWWKELVVKISGA